MTIFDNEKAVLYLRGILEYTASQGNLSIGRMHNRTVHDQWGSSRVITLKAHHLTLVLSGQARFTLNGEGVVLRRGTLLFTSPGCEQTYGFDPSDRPTVLTVRFDPDSRKGKGAPPQPPARGCCLSLKSDKEHPFLELMEHLFRCWIRRSDPFALQAAHCTLQSLLWGICEASPARNESRDRLMEDIRLKLDSDPEADWAIADLAKEVGLSAAHFSRRFHRYAGVTAKSYQFQSRMQHARDLLLEHGLSVKEVAGRLGYSDPFVFSRQFKKMWGVPPSKI
jgi:AraC-like DNA-binding protein